MIPDRMMKIAIFLAFLSSFSIAISHNTVPSVQTHQTSLRSTSPLSLVRRKGTSSAEQRTNVSPPRLPPQPVIHPLHLAHVSAQAALAQQRFASPERSRQVGVSNRPGIPERSSLSRPNSQPSSPRRSPS